MSEVGTLYVVSSSHGDYSIDDIVAGLAWSNPAGDYFVLVVSENEVPIYIDSPRVQSLKTELPHSCDGGFHRAAALGRAIASGFRFKRAVLLADSVLIRGGSLDQWLSEFVRDDLGAIGVGDARSYASRMQDVSQLFYEWGRLGDSPWESPPTAALSPAFIALPYVAAKMLHDAGMLSPPNAERWPHGFGTYLPWMLATFGASVVAWGWTEKVLPPLYVASPSVRVTAPHILSDRFMVFSSVRQVCGYSEADLREMFKRQRDEPHREIPPFGPQVFQSSLAAIATP